MFNISSATYYDWARKLESGFKFGEKARESRKRKIDKETLRQAVKERPDAFQRELAEQFKCHPSAIGQALKKMNITRKKVFTYSEKSEEKRSEYICKLKRIPEKKRVFIDECGTSSAGVNTFFQKSHGQI